MPFLTVYIAAPGTKHISSDGHSSSSSFGHMWYSVSQTQGGSQQSYGFAPIASGSPVGPGEYKPDDTTAYQSTAFKQTIYVSEAQYQRLQTFGSNPASEGFSQYYNGANNSCIDYTWKALSLIGVNPTEFNGNVLPIDNISAMQSSLTNYSNNSSVSYVISTNGGVKTYSYSNGATYVENKADGYTEWRVPSEDGSKTSIWRTEWDITKPVQLDQKITTFKEINSANNNITVTEKIENLSLTKRLVTNFDSNSELNGSINFIETLPLTTATGQSEFTAVAVTNVRTGAVEYQIRATATGEPIASGENYVVNANNTISMATAGGGQQVFDLATGKLALVQFADGSGLVPGPDGNDIYFAAGGLQPNANGTWTVTPDPQYGNSGPVTLFTNPTPTTIPTPWGTETVLKDRTGKVLETTTRQTDDDGNVLQVTIKADGTGTVTCFDPDGVPLKTLALSVNSQTGKGTVTDNIDGKKVVFEAEFDKAALGFESSDPMDTWLRGGGSDSSGLGDVRDGIKYTGVKSVNDQAVNEVTAKDLAAWLTDADMGLGDSVALIVSDGNANTPDQIEAAAGLVGVVNGADPSNSSGISNYNPVEQAGAGFEIKSFFKAFESEAYNKPSAAVQAMQSATMVFNALNSHDSKTQVLAGFNLASSYLGGSLGKEITQDLSYYNGLQSVARLHDAFAKGDSKQIALAFFDILNHSISVGDIRAANGSNDIYYKTAALKYYNYI
jgi:hypothetical protein